MAEAPTPRLIVTDALGRRIVTIDKTVFTMGRRTETDLRLPGTDISRVHAEIHLENGACIIRDKQSRFGTFVNGERMNEKVLAHGDEIRLGQSTETQIVFVADDEAPSVERSAISAATELRHMATLLEGLRALGSGRVLDEVLALVLDSAIEVSGAERGFIMLANPPANSSSSSWRARGEKSPCRARTSKRAARFPKRSSPPASRRLSKTCWTATWRSPIRARSPSASATCSARPFASCGTWTERNSVAPTTHRRAVPRQPRTWRARVSTRRRRPSTRSAPRRRWRSKTRGCTARRSTRRRFDQELKVAAAIQQSLLPPGDHTGRSSRALPHPSPADRSAAISSTTSI